MAAGPANSLTIASLESCSKKGHRIHVQELREDTQRTGAHLAHKMAHLFTLPIICIILLPQRLNHVIAVWEIIETCKSLGYVCVLLNMQHRSEKRAGGLGKECGEGAV